MIFSFCVLEKKSPYMSYLRSHDRTAVMMSHQAISCNVVCTFQISKTSGNFQLLFLLVINFCENEK